MKQAEVLFQFIITAIILLNATSSQLQDASGKFFYF
jgi:hypothetical protein